MRFSDIYALVCEDKLSDELGRSTLSLDQKEKVRQINLKLSNKTKYIPWLIQNIDDLPENTDELLNWFQSRNDLDDKDIAHYDVARLKALHSDKSDTKSQERKAIRAVTDEEGAVLVYKNDFVKVWKVLKAEWLRRNYANTEWCVASSEYEKNFKRYTVDFGLTLYVINDSTKIRYNQSTKSGDKTSDVCIGVTVDGKTFENARQYADNTSLGKDGVLPFLVGKGIKPGLLGLDVSRRRVFENIIKNAGNVVVSNGRKIMEGTIKIPMDFEGDLVGLGIDVVEGDFICAGTRMTSLVGGPMVVTGDYICDGNDKLSNLKGGPTRVGGVFSIAHSNHVASLVDSPRHVGSFVSICNNIQSLEGSPFTVDKDYTCSSNDIKDLRSAPSAIGRDFDCSMCDLTSLHGIPKTVGGDFIIYPEMEGDAECRFTEEEIRGLCQVEGKVIRSATEYSRKFQ